VEEGPGVIATDTVATVGSLVPGDLVGSPKAASFELVSSIRAMAALTFAVAAAILLVCSFTLLSAVALALATSALAAATSAAEQVKSAGVRVLRTKTSARASANLLSPSKVPILFTLAANSAQLVGFAGGGLVVA